MTLEALKSEIGKLTERELKDLAAWFAERDYETWDAQIREDHAAGKLDAFIARAKSELEAKTLRELP